MLSDNCNITAYALPVHDHIKLRFQVSESFFTKETTVLVTSFVVQHLATVSRCHDCCSRNGFVYKGFTHFKCLAFLCTTHHMPKQAKKT
jgi:hypothetical protein